MSAIAGLYRFSGPPVRAGDVDRLLGALTEFGPEASSWIAPAAEGPVGLGCRPFRVTPEDAFYRPPLRSRDGRIVLVADARIDNRDELAAALGIPSVEARGLSDAAFILAAYEAWEAASARRLLGDFAFALWDERNRSLFCARDGLGQRVLFLHQTPRRLAFATTARALLALDDVTPRLDQEKVAEYLVLLQSPATTFFEGIRRLAPGHALTATPEGLRSEPFWSPRPARSIRRRSDRDYVAGFLEVFDTAVQARLRSAGPVGAMMSGGLDSTSVAATAALRLRSEGRRLQALHSAPRPGFTAELGRVLVADESADVEAVAALHPNLDVTIRRIDPRRALGSPDLLFAQAGLPIRNPANWGWFEDLYGAARDAGVRVLLTGHKGNATISYTGLKALGDLARAGRWGRMYREVRGMARARGQDPWRVLARHVLEPLVPAALEAGYRRFRGASPAAPWEDAAIRADFARAIGIDERLRQVGRDRESLRRQSSLTHRIAILTAAGDAADLESGLRGWFGVESRDPTADLRVVDYCLSIPDTQYLRDGTERWLVRRAMRGRLPDRVVERTTYGAQAADWTEWLPALRPSLAATLARIERSETARRWIDTERLRSLLDAWPEPLRRDHEPAYKLLLLRGLTLGRFICWFEEKYS